MYWAGFRANKVREVPNKRVAPDRGGITVFHGSMSHQPPRQVNGTVRCSKNRTTMSINNPEVVDAIGIERDSDVVVLTICDHLDWYCAEEHLLALQDKINRYLGFVENELLDAYPLAMGRSIRLDVLFKFQPTECATQFLIKARLVAEEYGVMLYWRVPSLDG